MSYMWGLCWPVEASHALCNFSTLSWHVWDSQTDACSHSICMALTTQRLWNTKKVLIRLAPGMTSVLVATISTSIYPEHLRLHSRYTLCSMESNLKLSYKLNYWVGWDDKIQSSKPLFKESTDAKRFVYSPTSLKQFEHCFIFLFTHPLHLSQSPHKNRMHLCQRVSLGLFSFLPKSLLWFLYPLSWRHSNREENGSLTSGIHADQARPEGKGGIAAMGCKTLLGLPALNQILLTSEKNENVLIPSAIVFVRLMSWIFALAPLFKNGGLKYWTWGLAYASRNNSDDLQLAQ